MLELCSRGSDAQKAMAQDALNRWWWPSLMMFGPNDSRIPKHSAQSMAWKIKRFSNDELAAEVRRRYGPAGGVPRIAGAGRRPRTSTTRPWSLPTYGEIDWQEFLDVLAGNGQCNRERMATRRAAHENGAWVREAARAYAEKQTKRAAA